MAETPPPKKLLTFQDLAKNTKSNRVEPVHLAALAVIDPELLQSGNTEAITQRANALMEEIGKMDMDMIHERMKPMKALMVEKHKTYTGVPVSDKGKLSATLLPGKAYTTRAASYNAECAIGIMMGVIIKAQEENTDPVALIDQYAQEGKTSLPFKAKRRPTPKDQDPDGSQARR